MSALHRESTDSLIQILLLAITPSDVNECEESTETICGENSVCVNEEGSYSCNCIEGYAGDDCIGMYTQSCVTGRPY